MLKITEISSPTYTKRFCKIQGEREKHNDVFVCGSIIDCKTHVIYFGGDVQDYPENMELHRDNKKYTDWNIERTAALLHHKIPHSLVFAIKPTKMHLRTFAVYSNFVETNHFGSPTHSSDFGAIKHLSCLYSNTFKEVSSDTDIGEKQENIPVVLIGFSKGCVVLNQLVSELPVMHQQAALDPLFKMIRRMLWLDGGHSGGAEASWLTEDAPLKHLCQLGCDIEIHVTPYQVQDPLRKWIGEQEANFHKKLKKFGAKITETEHFFGYPASIEHHFKILEHF